MSVSASPPTEDEAADAAGRMAGEYRLGRKLGEGGFGAVYEAEHPLLKRRAAVKVLHRAADRDSDAVQRFIAEAQAVNQIRNRHIVDIFSFGKLSDGRHFYVMDLLDGEPLDRHLARAGRVPVSLVVQIMRPIAEALDRAHAAGIVHRDLKPQNIFLSWESSGTTAPVLLDFGVAKLLGDSSVRTVSGTPIGTPMYMSPEQARGEKVDGRADVYALGVVCHELLTGRPPLGGESTIAVLMAHVASEPPRVSEVCSDLSPELDAPILHMLAKKPADRPATAGEALFALGAAAERAGITIAPGLPQLPRPEPLVPTERPGEMSRTVKWAGKDASAPSEPAEAQRARLSSQGSGARGRTLSWLLVLVALGVGGALWFMREQSGPLVAPAGVVRMPGPQVEPPAPVESSPQAAPPSPVKVNQGAGQAGAAVPGAPGEPASPAPEKRKKRAPQRDAIPSDLESPF